MRASAVFAVAVMAACGKSTSDGGGGSGGDAGAGAGAGGTSSSGAAGTSASGAAGTSASGAAGTSASGTGGESGSAGPGHDASAGSGGGGGSGGGAGGGGAGGGGAGGSGASAGGVGDASADGPVGTCDQARFLRALYGGVWLMGWSGALEHYSWVKFSPSSPTATNGTWAALDTTCVACTGFFPCEGTDGLFSATPQTCEIVMQHPTACFGSGAATDHVFRFISFSPPTTFPAGHDLGAIVEDTRIDGGSSYTFFRYVTTQCNPGFTSCTDPF